MNSKQPTETMTQQAEELQRLGLCQAANEWIYKCPKCGTYYISEKVSEKTFAHYCNCYDGGWCGTLKEIGPLATASEAYPELLKLTGKMTDEAKADLSLKRVFNAMYNSGDIYDLDQAFRQALIELAKEG